jgi:hypothetical protein
MHSKKRVTDASDGDSTPLNKKSKNKHFVPHALVIVIGLVKPVEVPRRPIKYIESSA